MGDRLLMKEWDDKVTWMRANGVTKAIWSDDLHLLSCELGPSKATPDALTPEEKLAEQKRVEAELEYITFGAST
jgi:hypothetical protein